MQPPPPRTIGVGGNLEALTGGRSRMRGAYGQTGAKSSRVRQGGTGDGTVWTWTPRGVPIGDSAFPKVGERGREAQAPVGGEQRRIAAWSHFR